MSNVTNTLLDRVAKSRGLHSDYAIAKALGASRQAISSYRNGVRQMDDGIALKAAKLLNEDAAAMLCELHAERSRDQTVKDAWKTLASLARKAALSTARHAAAA